MKNIFLKRYNRKVLSCITAAVMICSAVQIGISAQDDIRNTMEFYVSPDGSDSGRGTIDDPFATIAAARDAVREAKDGFSGDITVYLREGRYYQASTLEFTSEDSGSDDCTITYKSYKGETAIIDGAVALDSGSFTKPAADDAIAARIKDSTARENVLVYDLSGLNINYDEQQAVYYGGSRALEARYPNDGYVMGFDSLSGKTFYDTSNVVGTWAEPVGVKIIGMFEIDWASSDGIISSYDSSSNRVTVSTTYTLSANSGRYYYANVIEEMDMVGEYYIDEETETLYFYAPADYMDIVISIASCKDAVVKAEVNNYTFDGIIIEGGYDDNISITGNDNCIENSTIRCCGDTNIYINGFRNTLYNNDIYHSGGSGIDLYGGDTKLLIPSNSLIDNNKIHAFGDVHRVYNGAIYADGIGFVISHNEIYDAPHTSFTNVACEMLFENNYIHDVCYEAGDAGAIYEGGWSANGNIYRNNLFKDIVNDLSIYYSPNCYYNDDAGGGKTFVSNIIINVDGHGVACGGGRDNVITDNIIIGTSGFAYDQRAYYPGAGPNSGWQPNQARFGVDEMYGLWASLMPWDSSVWGRVDKTPAYARESWAIMYPWTMLLKTTNVVDLEDNYVPYAWGNTVVRNNVLGMGSNYEISNQTEAHIEYRDNISGIMPEDIFVDYEGGDYTVKEDSKIYKLIPGLKACDISTVGIQPVD